MVIRSSRADFPPQPGSLAPTYVALPAVDWAHGLVRLERKQTKGKQARTAPIYGDLPGWLDMAYSSRTCEYIVKYEGGPITGTKTAWRTARKKAGVPELLLHDLRRTAVRNMTRSGIQDKQAALISGHKTKAIFMRYDITDDRDTQDAGRKLDAYLRAERAGVRTIDQTEGGRKQDSIA